MKIKTAKGEIDIETDLNFGVLSAFGIEPIENLYAIYSQEEELFWSNIDGWVSFESASLYTKKESMDYPIIAGAYSIWICLYNEP